MHIWFQSIPERRVRGHWIDGHVVFEPGDVDFGAPGQNAVGQPQGPELHILQWRSLSLEGRLTASRKPPAFP